MKKLIRLFFALIVAILVSPILMVAVAFGAQPSLSVGNVLIETNRCEEITGIFTVTNGGEASGTNTATRAILQAHVPPSAGGQAKFFSIKEIDLSNQNLSSGETQTRSFSIGGFIIPENTNSVRVEIQVIVAEREKVFISRSESFKPPVCVGIPDILDEPGEPTKTLINIPTDEPEVLAEKIEVKELPETGANEFITLAGLGFVLTGFVLRRIITLTA